jgi:hypothetical protein
LLKLISAEPLTAKQLLSRLKSPLEIVETFADLIV